MSSAGDQAHDLMCARWGRFQFPIIALKYIPHLHTNLKASVLFFNAQCF